MQLIEGAAPDALNGLAAPDAIFIGGGLSEAVFETAWQALKPLGRFVGQCGDLRERNCLDGPTCQTWWGIGASFGESRRTGRALSWLASLHASDPMEFD
jgi:hypothetical protein